MPIYDYACTTCGRVTEVIHGINDHGPRFCPECGTEGSMRKTMTAPAVVFKGSGWAKVDRRGSSAGRAAAPAASKAKSGGGDGPSSSDAATSTTAPAEPVSGGTASGSDGGGD